LGTSLVAWFGTIVYPIAKYLKPPPEQLETVTSVAVGAVEEFAPDSGKIFRFGRKPGLLVRAPDGEFKAFEATCTHLDCIVQYRSDLGFIWCACHNGRYDLAGTNIGGPPPRPLTELRVDVKEGQVFVSRMA
jgi:Rieske Fe-S protein